MPDRDDAEAQIEYDFFDTMRQKRAHYGYYMMSSEVPAVTVGLWNFVEDYVNTHLRRETARCAATCWATSTSNVLWGMRGGHFHLKL